MSQSFKLTPLVLLSTVFCLPMLLSSPALAVDVTTCNPGLNESPTAAPGVPTIKTSTNLSFTVQPSGCVYSNLVDGIALDLAGTSVVVAPNANNPGYGSTAVRVDKSTTFAFNVTQAGSITVGANSVVLANNTVVRAAAPLLLTINAGGVITGNTSAIDILATGTNSVINNAGGINPLIFNNAQASITVAGAGASITNTVSGTIVSKNGKNTIELNSGATGATIVNSGSIKADVGNNAIFVNATKATITNIASGPLLGVISGSKSAITVAPGGTFATVNNSGYLQGVGNAATLAVAGDSFTLSNSAAAPYAIGAQNNQNAIELNTGATKAIINNTGVIDTTPLGAHGIFVGETGATINNTAPGIITAQKSAININAAGTLATITNTGTLTASGIVATLDNKGAGLTLTNSGTISANVANGILLNEDDLALSTTTVTTIINKQTGVISGGSAININNANVTGINLNLQNSGTITGTQNGILIDTKGFNGTITNTATGVIKATGGAGGAAIFVFGGSAAPTGTIQNQEKGLIANTNPASASSTVILSNNLKAFINAGTILHAGAEPAIGASSNAKVTDGIVNTGDIISAPAQVAVNTNAAIATLAVDLSGGSQIDLKQMAGSIIGNVSLSKGGGTVLDLTGGKIQGTVTVPNVAGTIANFQGGTITYSPTSLIPSGNDTINISGTTMNRIDGSGGVGVNTYNVTSGSFIALNDKASSTMNVKSSSIFKANQAVVTFPASVATDNVIKNLGTIHVVNPDTIFTVESANNAVTQAIQGLATLTLDAGTTMQVNANIGAPAAGSTAINNNGILSINTGPAPAPSWFFDAGIGILTNATTATLNIAPSAKLSTGAATNKGIINIDVNGVLAPTVYTQSATGRYGMGIGNNLGSLAIPGASGQIVVAPGNATVAGTIAPDLATTQFLPSGTFYDIVTTQVGLPIDTSTLVQPDSALIFFEKSTQPAGPLCTAAVGGGCVVLVARARPFSEVLTCPSTQGIADNLTGLSQGFGPSSPALSNLLAQLQLQTFDTINDAVEQLVPQVNGAVSNAADKSFDFAFASIQRRLEDLRELQDWGAPEIVVTRDGPYGYSYGDKEFESAMGTWIYGAGTYYDQRGLSCASGYRGDAATLAIGTDWSIVDGGSRVGFVLNQTNTHSINKNSARSIIDSRSTQGTVYAWFDPMESVFADVAIGFASHHFETRRNIAIGNIATSAVGSFSAIEYGAQMDLGYAFLYDNAVVAPIMRARYTRFSPTAFTEENAGDLDLNTRYLGKNTFLLGAGFRAAGRKGNAQVMYSPEISFMFFRELFNNLERAESNFRGGGAMFPTVQEHTQRNRYVWGVGLNTHSSDKYVFSVKYEMDIRDHYVGNTGSLQLTHYWS